MCSCRLEEVARCRGSIGRSSQYCCCGRGERCCFSTAWTLPACAVPGEGSEKRSSIPPTCGGIRSRRIRRYGNGRTSSFTYVAKQSHDIVRAASPSDVSHNVAASAELPSERCLETPHGSFLLATVTELSIRPRCF